MNSEIALPQGYQFAGVAAGFKTDPTHMDLAVIVSDRDCTAAGVFTTNKVCAAPVHSCKTRLPSASIRGLVVNAGNANACTGEQGNRDAESMCASLAEQIGCESSQVLVCSTGIIGRLMPMEKMEPGISSACAARGATADHVVNAARAIMTTDTRPKVVSRSVDVGGKTVRLLGITKGAAMIGPKMATTLGFLFTDAALSPTSLATILKSAMDHSYHCISVEGHTSTNDTFLILANGASGAEVPLDHPEFTPAVTECCQHLAREIIDDAEGASHRITIQVQGTRTDEEARRIAKTVADSALVKTAVYGNDPNWGRICSAAGYAGVDFAEKDMSLTVNGTLLYDAGVPTDFDEQLESERMKSQRECLVELTFTLGDGRCRFWTCDLTREYVHLNADYTT